jgi:Ca2+/Na+ antiporter
MYELIKRNAEKMLDADIYPIISLIIFFLFFVVLLVVVKKMKKETVDRLSNIPLDSEDITNTTTTL